MKFALMAACACVSTPAFAQFSQVSQFTGAGSLVGGVFHPARNEVWAYQSFGSAILKFTPAGALLGSLTRPGEAANDADLEVAPAALNVGPTIVPAGTILFIDGETNACEIYAINPATGSLLATLVTSFGSSHVVGGGYSVQRATFFLVQDGVPGGSLANRIAEINPVTGAVLNSFQITAVRPSFTVNFGDLDVGANGNLFIVSSSETTILELTPTGEFVQEHSSNAGLSTLCGLGIDETTCDFWTFSTGGIVTRIHPSPVIERICTAPPACDPDFTCDGNANQDDVTALINAIASADYSPLCLDPDFNQDGNVNQDDVTALIGVVAGDACPP